MISEEPTGRLRGFPLGGCLHPLGVQFSTALAVVMNRTNVLDVRGRGGLGPHLQNACPSAVSGVDIDRAFLSRSDIGTHCERNQPGVPIGRSQSTFWRVHNSAPPARGTQHSSEHPRPVPAPSTPRNALSTNRFDHGYHVDQRIAVRLGSSRSIWSRPSERIRACSRWHTWPWRFRSSCTPAGMSPSAGSGAATAPSPPPPTCSSRAACCSSPSPSPPGTSSSTPSPSPPRRSCSAPSISPSSKGPTPPPPSARSTPSSAAAPPSWSSPPPPSSAPPSAGPAGSAWLSSPRASR
ncbi:hypothetical protein NSERUTF1_5840 [Nocardia seriolae]|nr:hypothetical protein NSERUTF1_5840 [Nocardia seriolae]